MGNGGLRELVSSDMPSTSNALVLISGSLRESWVSDPLAPPLTLAKTDDGPFWGPFFFWFQRGLAVATALRRLAKYPKSLSEPALSLTDRPWPSEGRIQKV